MSKFKIVTKQGRRFVRARRVRGKISGTLARPRLSIFRSNRQLYVQIIDDETGRTLLGLDDRGLKIKTTDGSHQVAMAKQLGLKLAKQALIKKIKQIVFDRGGYRYTGRIKALADGARAGGLFF